LETLHELGRRSYGLSTLTEVGIDGRNQRLTRLIVGVQPDNCKFRSLLTISGQITFPATGWKCALAMMHSLTPAHRIS